VLEVTITHNLRERAEVMVLFNRRLIALDWGRKGPDPTAYTPRRAKQDVALFNEMREKGAAVIASYKGATVKRSDRLIGWVEPGSEFVQGVNDLLCLTLSKVRVVDSSKGFLGHLVPRQCTLQTCHDRSKGRLAAAVLGTVVPRSVWSLHTLDLEWLATNFLIIEGLCLTVWSGGRSYEAIDHAGYSPSGREVLAQTTVSQGFVGKKAARLLELRSSKRDLVMFGPSSAREQCPAGIHYYAIEDMFTTVDSMPEGRWLVDLMLNVADV
jgi:hypothetical protein